MVFCGFRYTKAAQERCHRLAVLTILVLSTALSGCSVRRPAIVQATELPLGPVVARPTSVPNHEPAGGIHHVVTSGQTLWSIARAYDHTLDELVRANGLEHPDRLETGRELWIPGASHRLEIPPRPDVAGLRFDGLDLVWPVSGGEVLSPFGATRGGRRHAGVDIGGRPGEPIRAVAAGRVTFSGASLRGYGKTVVLDHGAGFSSLYAHNSELLVSAGQQIERGQTIARVGRTGNASTDHVHLEIRQDRAPIDPLPLLPTDLEARR